MPAAAAGPQLNRTEVIERLVAEAPPAVVTPNRRLARALERDVSFARLASGLRTWRSPDILPVTAFVERAYAALLYSERGAALPLLLTQAQEQALWESAIRDSGAVLIAVPDAAALAREAWQLAHAWGIAARIQGFPGNDDVRAFADWALRYQRKTADAGQIDTARLTDLLARYWGCDEIGRPGELIAYGFDAITPQQSALLSALAAAGCKVARAGAEPLPAHAVRIACADSRDEIARAAAWARARLEARPDARIGVVVPELARQRAALLRAFSAAMRPDYALPGQAPRGMPFNVSLGEPLNACPLVNAALGVLELASREIAFERASRLLRSPFIAGAEAERLGRARADAALRRRAEPSVTLDRLLALLAREGSACPLLLQRLSALAELRRQRLFGAQRPSALAQAMHEALARAGFPGERSLDSAEFQALQKWHELLAAFAALDRVLARTSYAEALARLRRMAADTLFQPETPEVPVQILGVLEAAGMQFDHLWVMGLSDQSWPPAPRPNPFLPIELQRAARITHSTAPESLLWAQRQTEAWLAAAHEVVLSHPQRDQDRELQASALIGAIGAIVARPAQSSGAPGPPAPDPVGYREQVHGSSRMESLADSAAPPVALPAVLRGGTAVLSDQAACPFRATARHRLGANALEAPHSGLDARERGTLVHRVLARTWTELGSKAALDALPPADLDALLARAAEHALALLRRERPALLRGRFAEIERRRLMRLARGWLEHEHSRGGFSVAAVEDRRTIAIGGLNFTARLDRVDELADGRRIVIDYKSRAPAVGALVGARPDEPQLPLYLVATEPDAVAVAFAQVRAGDMRFVALARDADALPGAKTLSQSRLRDAEPTWQQQLAAWREQLGALARRFIGGAAEVDPKSPATCRGCDVRPFCRIHEQPPPAPDEDAADP